MSANLPAVRGGAVQEPCERVERINLDPAAYVTAIEISYGHPFGLGTHATVTFIPRGGSPEAEGRFFAFLEAIRDAMKRQF